MSMEDGPPPSIRRSRTASSTCTSARSSARPARAPCAATASTTASCTSSARRMRPRTASSRSRAARIAGEWVEIPGAELMDEARARGRQRRRRCDDLRTARGRRLQPARTRTSSSSSRPGGAAGANELGRLYSLRPRPAGDPTADRRLQRRPGRRGGRRHRDQPRQHRREHAVPDDQRGRHRPGAGR